MKVVVGVGLPAVASSLVGRATLGGLGLEALVIGLSGLAMTTLTGKRLVLLRRRCRSTRSRFRVVTRILIDFKTVYSKSPCSSVRLRLRRLK